MKPPKLDCGFGDLKVKPIAPLALARGHAPFLTCELAAIEPSFGIAYAFTRSLPRSVL
jgi:hypothetical protein